MKAVRYTGGTEPIAVRNVDRPAIEPGTVRIDVRAASLCGSDLHYRDPDSDFAPDTVPVTLGHEGAGVVTDVGEGASRFEPGDHVVVHYVDYCGHCEPCLAGNDNRCRRRASIGHDLDGTFAEEVVVPETCAVPVGEDVPFGWSSIAGCAGATGFHALARADLAPGDTVAVFGAGGVGLSAIQWAGFLGAGTVLCVEPVATRRDVAEKQGADLALSPEAAVSDRIAAVTDGWGVDVAVECSGSPDAMRAALDAVDGANEYETGTVVSVGLQETPIEATYWGLREGELLVSGDHTRGELRTIAELLSAGEVDLSTLVADRIGLDDVHDGLDRLAAGDVVGRLVITPGE